ncbi:MAG: tetratricopeptide repeat protein [Gammaproteobacteria bacterium]|nr:tetratricopeptide repeat protein [Gammaproteobacteria bacterium]
MLNWFKKAAGLQDQKNAEAKAKVSQWINDGFENLKLGNGEAARNLFEKVLKEQPNNADALYMSGVLLHGQGRNEAAAAFISRAIDSDNSVAAFHITLGAVLKDQNKLEEAQASILRAIALDPDDEESRTNVAWLLCEAGRPGEAVEHLRHALRLAPNKADLHCNLGSVLQSLGREDEAARCYRDALSFDSGNATAGNNLGAILHAQGNVRDAIECFRQTLDKTPGYSQSWVNLAIALQAIHQVDEAESCLLRAIRLDPQNFKAYSRLAVVMREQGRLEESKVHSAHALAIQDSVSERVRLATLLPVIALSEDEIKTWRKHFDESMDELLTREDAEGALKDPFAEVGVSNFHLAYQPECNRSLQEKAGRLYSKLCPELLYTAPHCYRRSPSKDRRIKIGFISRFMHDHSIGRTTRGVLAKMSRDRFHVIALFVPPFVDDYISKFVRDSAEQSLVLPKTLEAARKMISELELDVLYYQDIGMDAFTYFLAFSRLAPVQCVSFGHPDTTGIANMDYWVSSENFETEGASEHYSEQLFLLRNLGTLAYYYRPTLTQPAKARSDFGLPRDRNVYLCPQSLFKLYPDFDVIMANILRHDPSGEMVLIEARTKFWGELLRRRFQEKIPDVCQRIRFLPGMSQDDFLALIAACDVMLDTIYFNGMNTSLEAFAIGTPVVTLPTALQRGRHTYGMYKQMDLHECIASTPDEYVEISVRLGTDRKFRDEVKSRILSRSMILYEDSAVVSEFERFFVEAHDRVLAS